MEQAGGAKQQRDGGISPQWPVPNCGFNPQAPGRPGAKPLHSWQCDPREVRIFDKILPSPFAPCAPVQIPWLQFAALLLPNFVLSGSTPPLHHSIPCSFTICRPSCSLACEMAAPAFQGRFLLSQFLLSAFPMAFLNFEIIRVILSYFELFRLPGLKATPCTHSTSHQIWQLFSRQRPGGGGSVSAGEGAKPRTKSTRFQPGSEPTQSRSIKVNQG